MNSNLIKRITVLFLSLLQVTLFIGAHSLSAEEDARAVNGRALYNVKGCYLCHGFEGQGALVTGSRLAPQPLPSAAFANALRRPRNVMPAYSSSVLSETEVESIHYFLSTIP